MVATIRSQRSLVLPTLRSRTTPSEAPRTIAPGIVFPWPDDRTLQNHYDDYGRRYYSLDGLQDFLLSSKHYYRELALLLRRTKPGTLLDVGCSVGGFVQAAGELGYRAEGIEVSPS